MSDRAEALRGGLEAMLGVPFSEGNRVDVLRNGIEIFPAMLEAIAEARTSIDFLTFVYWRGAIADRFAHALAEKARAGVRTRVLLDAVGARHIDEALVDEMKSAGAEVCWFRPLSPWRLRQADARTHRKVLICDGRVGFTGGVGIAEEWEGDARHAGEWRETHYRLLGPSVRGLQAAFLENWIEASSRRLRDPLPDPLPVVDAPAEAGSAVQVLRSSAGPGWTDARIVFHALLGAARTRCWLTTAYFVPDEETVDAMLDASQRGVDVRVLVPGPVVDTRLSQLAGQDVYEPLLAGGIQIAQYVPTMLHAKALTVDGLVAVIGSANFNQRSMARDDEILVNVVDAALVRELDAHFLEDEARAEAIDPARWRRRGLWQRVLEAATRLIRPQI